MTGVEELLLYGTLSLCSTGVTGVKGLFLEIKVPILSENDLLQQFDVYLTQHPNIKLVLIGKCQACVVLL